MYAQLLNVTRKQILRDIIGELIIYFQLNL